MATSVSGLRSLLGKAAVAPDTLRSPRNDSRGHGFSAFLRTVEDTLRRDLHLFQVDTAANMGLASGFLAALLSVLGMREVLWVTQRVATLEGGALYGPGLHEAGFAPGQLLFVEARGADDVLWAVEEGLRSRAIGAVVGEFAAEARKLDLTATRRLALRSDPAGVPAYLTAIASDVGATAARTRWRVSCAPSRAGGTLLGDPTWTLDLLKNRDGSCGRTVVGFSPARGGFFPVLAEPRQPRRQVFASGRHADAPPLVVPFARRPDEEDRR